MHHISQPTLIINENIARSNIKVMAAKARKNNLSFEPHFKTHQSKEVAEWFRDEGVEAITVSSISMAEYFAVNGWDKITIAFPVNILEINKLIKLSSVISLALLVQDAETIKKLDSIENTMKLLVEIDAGYHRSGVAHNATEEIELLIQTIHNTKHTFKGFYYHAGNSYASRSTQEIVKLYRNLEEKMQKLKNTFSQDKPKLAIGDTPTCSVMDEFKNMDSIHPGNFVFYDYTQTQIGSCNMGQVAIYVLCPVVAKSIERNELVIYGGGVHLSKESLVVSDKVSFGLVGKLNENGIFTLLPDSYVKSISQEHGIISSSSTEISHIQIGDLMAIIPVHSCMAVDCISEIYTECGIPITKMP